MIFYYLWLISFLLAALCLHKPSKQINLIAKVIAFISFAVASQRSDDFPDVLMYKEVWLQLGDIVYPYEGFSTIHGEIGFKLINIFLHLLSDESIIFFIFFSSLSFILILFISKKLKTEFSLIWIVYFSTSFLQKDLGQIRYSIASSLIVIAMIMGNSILKYIPILIASIFFQIYSIIILPILFIKKYISSNRSMITILSVIGISIYNFVNYDFLYSIFSWAPSIENYLNTFYTQVNFEDFYNPFPAIAKSVFAIIFLYYANKPNLSNDAILIKFSNSILISIFFYASFYNIPIIAQRFGGYFSAVIPFALCYSLRVNRNFTKIIFIFFCFFSFNYQFFYYNFLK